MCVIVLYCIALYCIVNCPVLHFSTLLLGINQFELLIIIIITTTTTTTIIIIIIIIITITITITIIITTTYFSKLHSFLFHLLIDHQKSNIKHSFV